MLAFLKRHRDALIVCGLLLYPLITFLTQGRKLREPTLFDRGVMAASSPMQRGMSAAVDGSVYGWKSYVALRGVKRENDALKVENAQLRAEVNAGVEARAENERLKGLLAFADANPGIKVPAHVVGVSPDAMRQWVRIDRGEQDGVQRGMAVVTPSGVAGQVMRTSANSADVMLITDANSRVGVALQRTRTRATAAGTGGVRLKLDNAVRSETLEEGDPLVTSGTDGVYPRGLPVGKVSSLQKNSGGLFWSANIVPTVDCNKLEEVYVMPAPTVSALTEPGAGPVGQGRR